MSVYPPCPCCGGPVLPRYGPDEDPWDGRLSAYCYNCALTRCDAYPGSCRKESVERTGAGWGQTIAGLDRLVCEFCTAVGEPIPVDAIAAARRHREALERIANEDYRGNRPTESVVAWKALRGE